MPLLHTVCRSVELEEHQRACCYRRVEPYAAILGISLQIDADPHLEPQTESHEGPRRDSDEFGKPLLARINLEVKKRVVSPGCRAVKGRKIRA